MSVEVDLYNSAWPTEFQQIRANLEAFLQGAAYLSIEHVGSTSVPGLAAKPIIDIDIFVTRENVQLAIDALRMNGRFNYMGELGIKDRHVLKDPNQSPRRNTYVIVDGTVQMRNHLAVRDVLRSNAELREEYAQLKLDLAAKGTNIIDYTEAKSVVVQKILRASGKLTPEELADLETVNSKGEKFGAMKTERLLLREFELKDVQGYFELESNEENARYQEWEPRTLEKSNELVIFNVWSARDTPRSIWELVVELEGKLIGRVGGKKTSAESEQESQDVPVHFDLWFSFLPSVQGKGYATEAMHAFINALQEQQKGKKLELEIECDPRNKGSWKLAERLGFEKFSLTERAWESKGEWVDSLVYRKMV